MTYSIADAAQHSGLSIDTLRYYERIGLVSPPARDSGGRRHYSDDDLRWLKFLTCLRTTGMPIRLMLEYAQLSRQGPSSASPRKQLLIKHRHEVIEHIAQLQQCLSILDYKITNYEEVERTLDELADTPVEEATA